LHYQAERDILDVKENSFRLDVLIGGQQYPEKLRCTRIILSSQAKEPATIRFERRMRIVQ
jgi:hypothetical protein